MYRGQNYRYKKKLNISSLQAAICNVALFKSMKERQFRDQIFISYSEDGVMLECVSQDEWQRASRYVDNFLKTKKMGLLAFGYDKEVYEELIIRGLKDYTRRMKELGEECPYINIIHYQKLRKSCEYMDKQRYIEPLKDWERKNKKNPNFAFLIVEPANKFEDVKRRLLEYLLKREVGLDEIYVSPLYFLLLFFTSSIKQEIKDNFQKTYIQLVLECNKQNWKNQNGEVQDFKIKITSYAPLKLDQLDYKVVSSSKHLSRLGLQFISSKQIEAQIKKIKLFFNSTVTNNRNQIVTSTYPFQQMHNKLIKQNGQDYCVIPFKKSQREKYSAVINKFVNACYHKDVKQLSEQIQKNIICNYDQMQILAQLSPAGANQRGYKMFKACINDCPFMIHEYSNISLGQVDTFLLYLQQLKTYYCTYLVRFYGITIKYALSSHGHIPADMSSQQKIQSYTYYLIFDYHHRTVEQMMLNDMILDNFQIAQMILQLVYLVNFLHTHEEPRSIGSLRIDQIYWPLKIVLPYLRSGEDNFLKRQEGQIKLELSTLGEGFEGDVRLAGLLMKFLLEGGQKGKQAQNQDDHFSDLLKMMLKESKYERIALTKCISTLQELLMLN